MIKFINFTKKYDDFLAVDRVNLEIKPGEIFGFLGPNGAGKTTSIKAMIGQLNPTDGSILIKGLDVTQKALEVKRITGYAPDQPFLYERLTGQEFLEFVCGLWSMDREKAKNNTERLLTLFNLQDAADDFIQSYSSGMKQKLNIIQALVHEPAVLVLDEPLNALDPKTAKQAKDLLREFTKKGGTAFLTTHALDTAERFCTRVGIINKGKLICTGTVEELKTRAEKEGGTLEDVFMKFTENGCENAYEFG